MAFWEIEIESSDGQADLFKDGISIAYGLYDDHAVAMRLRSLSLATDRDPKPVCSMDDEIELPDGTTMTVEQFITRHG